jgi:hypothetical protein
MTPILFVGGDIRVDPDLPDPTWDLERRERFPVGNRKIVCKSHLSIMSARTL